MLLPCEVAVKSLLPPVRAALAKHLMTKHGLKQMEAAKLLGVSQPAISLYSKKLRGKALDLEKDREIRGLIEDLADSLAKGGLSHKDFTLKFCEICKAARARGLLCAMHKALDPTFDTEKCELCMGQLLKCLN
ncbi:MAG: transcriptional regulator [Candidatus Bathyarchaeia archaeon]